MAKENLDALQTEEEQPQISEEERKRGTFEKRKPGTRVIDQFGNLEKKRRKVEYNGLSDMILPPYTKKAIATYRIIGSDDISRSTGEPLEPVDVQIPGTYMLYDKFQPDPSKREVFMKNLGRPEIKQNNITGRQEIDHDQILTIEFIRGVLKISCDKQYPLYVFIELHPLNKSNPYREPSLPALFERIDLNANRSVAFRLAEQDLGFEAEGIVMKLQDKDKILGYATSFGVPTMENGKPRPMAIIKSDLRIMARKNPKGFFSLGNDIKPGIRMTVFDAIQWGIVEADQSRKAFISPVTDELLHTWMAQEDPTESFVTFLSKPEGQEIYEAIKNQCEFWNN